MNPNVARCTCLLSAWKCICIRVQQAPLIVALLAWVAAPAAAQAPEFPDAVIDLTPETIQESMIAFVNLSTAPGVDGATFEVDEAARDADLLRSSLGYAANFTLKERVIDGYWGLALAYGELEDRVNVRLPAGQTLRLEAERDILSLRASLGLVLPLTQHLKLRPYMSVAASRLGTESVLKRFGSAGTGNSLSLSSDVNALTTSGTLVAIYDRWWGSDRLEISGQYTAAYTDTFDSSDELLDTWSWSETLLLKARFSGATGWASSGRSWRWNTYVTHTRLLGLDKVALGFTRFTEVGAGLDYEWNIRPLDWFGLRFLGFKAGVIFGDDITGFSAGLSF